MYICFIQRKYKIATDETEQRNSDRLNYNDCN